MPLKEKHWEWHKFGEQQTPTVAPQVGNTTKQFLAHVQTKTLIHVDNQGTPMIILLRRCLFGDHLCSFFCWGIGFGNVSLRIQVPAARNFKSTSSFSTLEGRGFCAFFQVLQKSFSHVLSVSTLNYGGPSTPRPGTLQNSKSFGSGLGPVNLEVRKDWESRHSGVPRSASFFSTETSRQASNVGRDVPAWKLVETTWWYNNLNTLTWII